MFRTCFLQDRQEMRYDVCDIIERQELEKKIKDLEKERAELNESSFPFAGKRRQTV